MRNLWHALFAPGYHATRYNTLGYRYNGLGVFLPAGQGWGVRSEDSVTQYGQRAAREMEYFPLKDKPYAVQRIFTAVQKAWLKSYQSYIRITSVLIVVAWIGALLGALCWAIPRTRFCRAVVHAGVDKLMAPIVAASALLLYEDLATSMFSQATYRYFHITEPYRLVIAGFGIAFVMRIAAIGASPAEPKRVSAIQKYDLLDQYFGRRRAQWIFFLVVVNASLFAWWTSSMIAHTWGS
jgi:hypothetical protein